MRDYETKGATPDDCRYMVRYEWNHATIENKIEQRREGRVGISEIRS